MSQLQTSLPPEDGYLVENDALIRLGGGSIEKGRARLRMLLADERDRKPIVPPTLKPDGVRLATIRDEPVILDLLIDEIAENGSKVAPPSVRRILDQVEMCTRAKGGFCGVVDGPDGVPWAVVVLVPTPWWFSDHPFIEEVALYVAPSARKTRAAALLIEFEKWLSDQMSQAAGHTIYLLAGVTASKRYESKVRWYSRHMNILGVYGIYPPVAEGLDL